MPYQEDQIKRKAEELPKQVICLCMNCEDRYGSNSGKCAMFCKNCNTKEKRAAMAAENEKFKKENAILAAKVV